MRKIPVILVFIIMTLSCEKTEKVCNCNNPLEDLPWLKELKSSFTNCSCQITIFQATYKKQTVYYSLMNDPLCDGIQSINLIDCSGEVIKTYTQTDQAFTDEVSGRKSIYVCKTK